MKATDNYKRPIVVVTGMGLITSLGAGKDANWKSLIAGRSGIRQIKRFATDGLKTTIAGTIDDLFPSSFLPTDLSYALAEYAISEALEQSSNKADRGFQGPLFIAVPPVELEWSVRQALAKGIPIESPVTYRELTEATFGQRPDLHAKFVMGAIADRVAQRFGTSGAPVSISTACASGATAIQMAVEAIRQGEAEKALAVGTDGSITTESLIRFSLLSALTTQNENPSQASKPFSKNRDGFVMAEGAAALVLESMESAHKRGAEILGILAGCGERADSFHRTRSNPNGAAVVGALQNALNDAGIRPSQIDYINAHGTSTPENDRLESFVCGQIFGDRMSIMPISSNKSMIGHTLTAAGAVEAVISFLTIQNGILPPTINYHEPDQSIELDTVPNIARMQKVSTIMSNSFGFGGQNTSLILSEPP